MTADDVMEEISRGIAMNQEGDRAGAQMLLARLWETIGPDGDPLHKCGLAHSMADTQEDPNDELIWDLRALEAADDLTDERLDQAGVPGGVAGFLPSLHLNLADVYRRLGDIDQARHHVTQGLSRVSHLEDNDYGRMIRGALERVATEIDSLSG